MEDNINGLYKVSLEGYTIDDMQKLLSKNISEKLLAQIIARVSNEIGLIRHDIDSTDNNSEATEKIIKEHNAWCELYKNLLNMVIKILEDENKTKGTNHILKGMGYHYIIAPFMERNGYTDGAGWWFEK